MTSKHIISALALGITAGCTSVTGQPVSNTDADAVTLVINFNASEEGLAEFAGIMDGVSSAMQTEEGFVSAVAYQNVDDPHKYVLVEVWETKELHKEHFDRINASGDWAHINSLLKSAPEMGYYQD